MRVFNTQFLKDQPMNANFSSPAQLMEFMTGCSVQLVISGTPNGQLYLEASSDPNTHDPNFLPTNWDMITDSNVFVTASGTVSWNVSWIEFEWLRVSYIDTSAGTSIATVTARINGKG